jgi:hypothetical protein
MTGEPSWQVYCTGRQVYCSGDEAWRCMLHTLHAAAMHGPGAG